MGKPSGLDIPIQRNARAIRIPKDQVGTLITVKQLHPDIAEKFGLENFETRLRMELESAHQEGMQKGLACTLNGVCVNLRPSVLLQSEEMKFAYKELEIPGRNGARSASGSMLDSASPLPGRWVGTFSVMEG